MSYIQSLATLTKQSSRQISNASQKQKNNILIAISDALINNIDYIITQNKLDLESAKDNGVPDTMLDRLMLNSDRVMAIANAVKNISTLNDPVGEIIEGFTRPNGLRIVKKRVPLGVIGIIYEARPNVTVDAAALCLKTSNAAILRGGKEAINSNKALVSIMKKAIKSVDFDENIISLVEDTSRETATEMMKLNGLIDVLIPRGGSGLINSVIANATVPVIETGVGNCHVYIDEFADLQKGVDIVYNAKVSRPSVCNACESLLIHKSVADKFLQMLKPKFDSANVCIFGCQTTKQILGDNITLATDQDYKTEYLDYKISIKVVDSIDDAINHIFIYSTKHSECIVTQNITNAEKFCEQVDAAAVYVNASTRFTDGEEFGFGAEIGISTQKLHARGPMGLKELTSIKYIINGDGHIR